MNISGQLVVHYIAFPVAADQRFESGYFGFIGKTFNEFRSLSAVADGNG